MATTRLRHPAGRAALPCPNCQGRTFILRTERRRDADGGYRLTRTRCCPLCGVECRTEERLVWSSTGTVATHRMREGLGDLLETPTLEGVNAP